ncbi:MAG: hypothetical protein IT294_04460 [Deltaproteobacteria bacterium]|nr:hypothetical protein [Deltaproteobacteria bacterium]
MDARIESIAKGGTEFLAEYTLNVVVAAGKFTETLLSNVGNLTAGVFDEGVKVVRAATGASASRP